MAVVNPTIHIIALTLKSVWMKQASQRSEISGGEAET